MNTKDRHQQPSETGLAHLHLGAARDALQLAKEAFGRYEPHVIYGDQMYDHTGDDGAWDLENFRRYLLRGRRALTLASLSLGLSEVVAEQLAEILGDGSMPSFRRMGPGGGDVVNWDLWALQDWLLDLERHAGGEATSSVEDYKSVRLHGLLKDTAHLVKKRGIMPERELDVQKVMHDYLRACFPDFVKHPSISWPTKSFKPDGGIPSLDCAIEFKYVRTRDDVARSTDQVFADAKGYAGDGRWIRFSLVYYMTSPVEQPSAIGATLRLAGLDQWDVIVVVGDGQ